MNGIDNLILSERRDLPLEAVIALYEANPEFQGRGIGGAILERLKARYQGFHQHMLVADGRAIDFYAKHGFERAGKTEPMWIYTGADH